LTTDLCDNNKGQLYGEWELRKLWNKKEKLKNDIMTARTQALEAYLGVGQKNGAVSGIGRESVCVVRDCDCGQ
jgi:hypothetical protein